MIIDSLHKQYPEMADLRMREIRVDKRQRTVSCVLSYPFILGFDNSAKIKITDFVRTMIPKGYFCQVKFVDDAFNKNTFTRNLLELLADKYPIYADIGKNDIDVCVEGKQINATFFVDAVTCRNMELADFCRQINDYYAEYTSYNVTIALSKKNTEKSDAKVSEQEKLVQLAINKELLKPSRHFVVTDKRRLFGKNIDTTPMYIADVRNPLDGCTLCGVTSNKICRKSKSNPLLYVCSFTLSDDSGGTLPCIVFARLQITDVETIMSETGKGEAEAKTLSEKRLLANDKKLKGLQWLANGMSVVVHGKLAYGQTGELELHVYDLATCRISPLNPDHEFKRPVADEYLLVKPETFTEYRQINFVELSHGQSLIGDKSLVVLHVNATGLGKVTEDKFLAVCAVKVIDGKVTERFFSYLNPEKEILDARMLEDCRLAQSKLIFYPTLTEIISDLYKFVYGCDIVGNDLEQIVQILNYYAAPMDYNFSNELVSQSELFSALWERSGFESSVNCSKLDDVAKKCGLSSKNSAFCYETALVAARCLSVLSDNAK